RHGSSPVAACRRRRIAVFRLVLYPHHKYRSKICRETTRRTPPDDFPESGFARIARMTSPSGKDPHGLVSATEPGPEHPQHIPGRSSEKPVFPCGRAFYPVQVTLLAAAYFGAAKVGLTMAFVAEQVTAVWPPTGIALAALLLFGSRAWPGIALGAFLANATTHAPLATAAVITLGNTLEALAGAWLLRRLAKFNMALERVQDVLALVVLGAGLST